MWPSAPSLDELPSIKRLVERGGVKLVRMEREPLFHFMVADERHVRLEAPHRPLKFEEDKPVAKIAFNTIRLGWKYARLFNRMWEVAVFRQGHRGP